MMTKTLRSTNQYAKRKPLETRKGITPMLAAETVATEGSSLALRERFMSSFNEIYGELKRRARARLDLHRREKPNNVLLITAGIQLALMVAMVVVVPFDLRLVSGVNSWFKPIKVHPVVRRLRVYGGLDVGLPPPLTAGKADHQLGHRDLRRGPDRVYHSAGGPRNDVAFQPEQSVRRSDHDFDGRDGPGEQRFRHCAAGVCLPGEIRGRATDSVGDCRRAADFSGGIGHRGSDGRQRGALRRRRRWRWCPWPAIPPLESHGRRSAASAFPGSSCVTNPTHRWVAHQSVGGRSDVDETGGRRGHRG